MIPWYFTKIRWNARTKQHYIDRGYKYTKQHDYFWIDVRDLSESSDTRVYICCDYCGKLFNRRYADHTKIAKNSPIKKDACKDCMYIKREESNLLVHGVENTGQLVSVHEKIRDTYLKEYGVEHYFQTTEFKEKARERSLETYGVEHHTQSQEVQDKKMATNMEKYGVPHVHLNEEIAEKIKRTNLKKYGVEYIVQRPDVLEKAKQALRGKNKLKASSQQIFIYETLKKEGYEVELNYPVGIYELDVALFVDGLKINVEYDGWYWHKDSLDRDAKRDKYMQGNGWEVLRVKGNRKTPKTQELLDSVKKIVNSNLNYYEIILEDWGDPA